MKLLTVTNLYPDNENPRHGVFVEERLKHILEDQSVAAEVLALRPGGGNGIRSEVRNGVRVHYLPVPTLPLVTNWIDPFLWQHRAKPVAAEILRRFGSSLIIDAHFLYPDGAAAVILGQRLGVPVVLTARGSDVNVKCGNLIIRQWVRWACGRSAAVITVSEALKKGLVDIGIERQKITVLRNGVDLDKFTPKAGGLEPDVKDGRLAMLSVGHLLEDKGHHFAIEALADIKEADLTIVGEGPYEASLRKLAKSTGVADRVTFRGNVPHNDMAAMYQSADVTLLVSAREGMPNVVLESIACGTRVVASDVGGIREVVTTPKAGLLVTTRSTGELVKAVRTLQSLACTREETRAYAVENLGWARVVGSQRELYQKVGCH